jgi:hypothetical protein
MRSASGMTLLPSPPWARMAPMINTAAILQRHAKADVAALGPQFPALMYALARAHFCANVMPCCCCHGTG